MSQPGERASLVVINDRDVMKLSDKNEFHKMKLQLQALRSEKNQEASLIEAHIRDLANQLTKVKQELHSISVREQAVTSAMRHIEDHGQ